MNIYLGNYLGNLMLFCACQFFCILEKFSVLILFNVFLIPLGFYISFAISHDSYVWSLHTILEFFDIMVIFLKKIIDVSVPCFFYFNLHLLYSFFSFYWICWWFLCSRCCILFIKILCLSIYIHVNFLLICPIMFLIVLSILLAFNYISLVFYPTSLTEYLFIVPFYKYVF